jgi:branched-subunit amino acid aminotransferase/4-amino-4-deoxychorismate lyase
MKRVTSPTGPCILSALLSTHSDSESPCPLNHRCSPLTTAKGGGWLVLLVERERTRGRLRSETWLFETKPSTPSVYLHRDGTNGCKHGEWEPYIKAKETAEAAGCDAALLIHEHAIVDGDRGTPMVLDEDGTVWLAPESDGGVNGITASILERKLPDQGFPVVRGRLNERTVARCAELVLVGTGMGACRVDSLDGEPVGTSNHLSEQCQRLLREYFTEDASWSQPRLDRVG